MLGFLIGQSLLFGSISVSPSLFELKIPPGKTFTDSVRVVNVTDATTDIIVYLSDFDLSEEGKIRFYDAGTTEFSLKDHVRVNPTSFTLEPGEEKWVRFSLRMPANQVGEAQGIIFFQTVPRKVKSPTGRRVLVAARIGSTVYAAMKPTINMSADIVNILFRRGNEPGTLEYTAIVHNDGNTHIRPKGKLTLFDPSGKKTIVPDINEKNSSILRNGVRLFEGVLSGSFPEGMYRATVELDFGKEAREVEKAIRLAPISGIPDMTVSYQAAAENKPATVAVSFNPGGMAAAVQNPRSFFRLRALLGEELVRQPLSQCLKQKNGDFSCRLKKNLQPGIYMAEILLFDSAVEDSRPVATYRKLEVKE
jgi:hypothetical protein